MRGSGTTKPTARTTPIAIPNLPGPYPLDNALTAWCSINPGEQQQALNTAMGQPTRQGASGTGHELWLNVTPQPLLSLVEAVIPMHRSEGYAIWRRGSYLMADTYTRSGSIARMDAWQVEVVDKGK